MKPPITYDDFDKIDVRIGTIESATAPEWSSKLLRFEVDFGEEIGKRVIFSGIKQWYSPDTFVGKQFPFLVNLAPKKMGPEESQGMMLMSDGEKPTLFHLDDSVQTGAIVR
ncbi:MAG: methionine--tRNA ligase [Candidatus Woesebacteria bacterium]